jgi:hypothetical protein
MEGLIWIVGIASLPWVVLNVPFIRALNAEAPEVWRAVGKPTVARFLLTNFPLTTYSGLVLFRGYRTALAAAPRARAWASWLFVAHWLQIAALLVWLGAIFLH